MGDALQLRRASGTVGILPPTDSGAERVARLLLELQSCAEDLWRLAREGMVLLNTLAVPPIAIPRQSHEQAG